MTDIDDYIEIQADYGNGCWRTLSTTINNIQYITHAMKNIRNSNHGKRIRAVNRNGSLIDIM